MKTFTIIGGVNGTGKSSLLGVLSTVTKDMGFVFNNSESFDSGIDDCLPKGVSFTQETTLSGHKTEKTAARAKNLGYTIRLYYVGLDTVQECLDRIENRVRHGGHNIREDDVIRRFAGRWEAVAKVLPYCDIAYFYDNYNGFRKTAEYVNGEFIIMGDDSPKWTSELRDYLKR